MLSSVPTEDLVQADRHVHLAGQIRVVELVRVADPFVRHQLDVLPAEGVAAARREVRERHLVGATEAGVHVMHLAGESVGRQPLDHRVRIEEGAIDPLGRSPQDAVKADGAWHDRYSLAGLTPE